MSKHQPPATVGRFCSNEGSRLYDRPSGPTFFDRKLTCVHLTSIHWYRDGESHKRHPAVKTQASIMGASCQAIFAESFLEIDDTLINIESGGGHARGKKRAPLSMIASLIDASQSASRPEWVQTVRRVISELINRP